jgi:phosphate-selective porin O/P
VPDPFAGGHHRRSSAHLAAAASALVLLAATASAQAVIKVDDTTNFKLGVLLQPQADWTQDTTGGYEQNLFLRRARLLVGGQLSRSVTFFLETDDANLGKVVGGTKAISTGFTLQDAFVEWKVADELIVGAGLMFIPLCRNCYESAGTLLPIDYGASSFLESGPTQSVVSRDTGFQARGYLAHNRLEYRVGAFQGARDRLSRNSFRSAGHLQYAFLDTESGFFTTGTYLGKKKVLTIGGGYDVQSDYKAFSGDAFFDRPIGAAGAVTLQADLIHFDGGRTFALPRQDDLLVEGGYLFTKARVMPWVKLETQRLSAAGSAGDQNRYQGGLSYFHLGQNVNIKAGYGVIDPKVGKNLHLFTVQLQIFYF